MFNIRKATMIVDHLEDVQVAARLNMAAVTFDDLVQGRVRLAGQGLVVSARQPHAKVKELVARGVSHADVRYVDMEGEQPLAVMEVHQLERLRWLFSQPLSVLGDRVRPLNQWPVVPPWAPWKTGDQVFDGILRWRPRTLAVVVGDEGSGKSTFSQLLAMKFLSGPTLYPLGVRASICAWEDDRENFREMVYKFCAALEPRLYWFEPDADPERLLDEYLSNVETLSKNDGVRLHIADPWNAFNHDAGSEMETKYVQRMLLQMQQMTKELDITIIVVTHLPKRPGRGLRPFGISDASHSKEFANKCDVGFCIANTQVLGEIPEMSEKKLEALRLTPEQVATVMARSPGLVGKEHMIVAVDKVKIRGMGPRGMGERSVTAFVYDREECRLERDSTATELAWLLWG